MSILYGVNLDLLVRFANISQVVQYKVPFTPFTARLYYLYDQVAVLYDGELKHNFEKQIANIHVLTGRHYD